MTPSPGGEAVKALLVAFLHWSIVAVGLLTWWFTNLIGALPANVDITGAVLGVSGTLVALIAPAASLAGQFFEVRLNYWAGRVAQERSGADVDVLANEFIARILKVGRPLWRSLVYMAVSLPCAVLAILRAPGTIAGEPAWHVELGASLALIVVATGYLLPFSWQIFQLKLAQELKTKLLS